MSTDHRRRPLLATSIADPRAATDGVADGPATTSS
jgi:hypothetical protein